MYRKVANVIAKKAQPTTTPSTPAPATVASTPTPSSDPSVGLTLEKVADVATDFIPIVGGVKDIYKGFRDGDALQASIGVVSLGIDIFTLGGGSIIKGGLKAAFKAIAKEGTESTIKQVVKEVKASP